MKWQRYGCLQWENKINQNPDVWVAADLQFIFSRWTQMSWKRQHRCSVTEAQWIRNLQCMCSNATFTSFTQRTKILPYINQVFKKFDRTCAGILSESPAAFMYIVIYQSAHNLTNSLSVVSMKMPTERDIVRMMECPTAWQMRNCRRSHYLGNTNLQQHDINLEMQHLNSGKIKCSFCFLDLTVWRIQVCQSL